MYSVLYPTLMVGSLVGYLLCSVLYPVEVLRNRKSIVPWRRGLLTVAVVLHLLGLIVFRLHVGHSLFTRVDGTALFFGWFIAGSLLVLEKKYNRDMVGVFALPVVFLITLYAFGCPMAASHQTRTLPPYWLHPHVGITLLGYVCFTLASCYALMYLMKERFLKHKQLSALFRLLPSLQTSDVVVYYLTACGLCLLTVGIVSGVILAHVTQTTYVPQRDPKVILSVALWCLYAGYFVARRLLGWRGRKGHLFNLFSFVIMLCTFFAQHNLPVSLRR